MGIFRKKKQVPPKKKEVRVEEFKFDKGFDFGIPDPKPGQIIQWGRRTGKNPFYVDEYGNWDADMLKKLMEVKAMPFGEGDDWMPQPQFGRGDEAKMREAADYIARNYPGVELMQRTDMGFDGTIIEIRKRGVAKRHQLRLSGTFLAQANIAQIVEKIRQEVDLLYGRPRPTPGERIDQRITGQPKTPTDEWAEKWARENK